MPVTQDPTTTMPELLEQLSAARCQTDDLFRIVKLNALYDRPIAERHRILFYIGHLEAFDWNLLRERGLDLKSFHPQFDKLFAFGIDPVGRGLPSDQPGDWPSLETVRRYVEQIRASIDEKLATLDLSAAVSKDKFPLNTLLHVAMEHRLMHAETLAYMLHQLPHDRKIKKEPAANDLSHRAVPPLLTEMIRIPAGHTTLGLSHDGDPFGWDNEYQKHTIEVPAFSVENQMVTNRQYLEFLQAGGYNNAALWAAADWEWKVANNIRCPVFWKEANKQWFYNTMFEEIPLPLEWPVYVSQAEASAYARWTEKLLPTEAQWQRAAYGTPRGEETQYPWGNEKPSPTKGNFDFRSWNPTPVGMFPEGRNAWGLHDVLGNGWEWTSSVFGPFPGFKPFPFYVGYSADFFDGKHFVIKGGSARTAASMLRRSFRNWFQPHYQYVYAGFRCVSHERE